MIKINKNFGFIYVVVFMFFSCSTKDQDKKMFMEIYKCAEEHSREINENRLNIYKEYINIEHILLDEKILSEKSKIGYKKAMTRLFNSTRTKQEYIRVYYKILKNIDDSDMLFFSGNLAMPFMCIGSYLESNSLHKTENYFKYFSVLKKVYLDFTPNNPQLYYDLIEFSPEDKMDEIIFRAPIISIIIGLLQKNVQFDEINE